MVFRFIVGFLLVVPLPIFAALFPSFNGALEVSLSPSSPQAGEVVTARVENISSSGSTHFVWKINGTVVDQGIGITQTTFSVKGLGSATTVSVSATENGVPRGEKTLVIRPAEVDIVWEGNTATPSFYSGLPLPNPDSTITLLAVPHLIQNGARVSADDITYTWFVNNSQKPADFGYGRKKITLTPPQFLNEFFVSVEAKTRGGDIVAKNTVVIAPQRPSVLVYEKAPLLGFLFEEAVTDSFSLTENEVTFVAFPLYINRTSSPTYQWSINGESVSAVEGNPREITFRREGVGSGRHAVGFSFESAQVLFERAATNFLITF
mgnify:CR=1 FL=1